MGSADVSPLDNWFFILQTCGIDGIDGIDEDDGRRSGRRRRIFFRNGKAKKPAGYQADGQSASRGLWMILSNTLDKLKIKVLV